MSRVARIDGKALFGEAQWNQLTARSNWRGLWLVVHAWLTVLIAVTVAVVWPHPLVLLAAVLIIGSRQLGISILMHDAAHGLLHSNTRWNDLMGQWLCAYPVGLDMRAYRAYHLKHHQFAQQEEDPDLVLSAPFPVSRMSMVRKIARDLSGLTFLKLRIAPILLAAVGRRRWRPADIALLVTCVLFATAAYVLGVGWAFWLLWLLPLATWQMLVARIRNIAEHAGVTNENDPWRIARTTEASWIARVLIAPYYVNYHAEHHLFMWTPCYRLPGLHRALRERALLTEHAVPIAEGYRSVLREVTL